jgi:hemoglobin
MNRSLTDLAGGLDAFVRLVDAFYDRVQVDPVLRPLYPDDLGPGKQHLALFLAQYFGATDLYSSQRGHPRLRMRHAAFHIDADAAARWATHMLDAVADQGFPTEVRAALEEYIIRATPTLINSLPSPAGSDGAGGLPTTT